MGRFSLELRVVAFAFLWLCLSESSWATKKEDLERAAELAVERSAERAAERAVEKALESGNSTSETETIRESYSSVRQSDKTLRLPGSGYTPAQRHEYDRIMREREAGERASALLKRSVDNRRVDGRPQLEVNDGQRRQNHYQQPQSSYQNPPEVGSPNFDQVDVTRSLPFPVVRYESSYATVVKDSDQQQQQHEQKPQQGRIYEVRDVDRFPYLYPVKVFTVQPIKPYPHQVFHILPAATAQIPIAPPTIPVNYHLPIYHLPIDNRPTRFTEVGDNSAVKDYGSRPGQGWIYR